MPHGSSQGAHMKKGVKIKDLAVEIGVTSRELIDRCRAEGMRVQNSITKISLAEARQVRSWFTPGRASSESPGSASLEAPFQSH